MPAAVTSSLEETFSEAFAALPRGLGMLGRYVLLEIVGQGGMGVVWKAYDPVLDRQIALKLLVASPGSGTVVSEAQAMARVQHPNVAVVYDAGVQRAGDHQLAYVAMELIAGRTLRTWLDEPGHSTEQILDMFLLAGRGLEAAHQAGLVHRDFKPANVLLGDDGRVRVADFGLSVVHAPDGPATGVPAAGTPRYMSPGQLHGLPPDVRSDQFAYCVALYRAVFGVAPFDVPDNATVEELRASILKAPKPPVRSRLAARVAPIAVRGLAVEPGDRWESMTALLAALDRVRRPRTRRVVVASAVGVVAIVGGVLAWQHFTDPTRACQDAADGMAALWRPERKQALAAGFAPIAGGGDSWQRVVVTLDDWTSRWSALRVEQCEADRNGERPTPTLTARHACLDRRLGELDGLLHALGTPDQTVVLYANDAAHGLTLPESCTSTAPPLEGRPPPPSGPGVAEAYAHVDRANALSKLGKEQPALEEAQVAADAAAKLGWAPLIADAQIRLGVAQGRVRQTDKEMEAFYAALWAAEAARDDDLRWQATMGLSTANVDASDYPMADRWYQTGQAIVQHLAADPARQARMAFAAMELALYEGRYKDCLATGATGLPLAEAVGPEAPILVKLLITLSQCERSLDGHGDDAVAHLERALAISEKIHGHQHQQTSMILSELGINARAAKQYDVALARYQDSLAIREAIVGPDNPDCAGLRNNIANVYRDQGKYDDARAELDKAIAIWTKTFGPDSPAVGTGFRNLGKIAMLEGHPEQAEPLFRKTLAISRAKRPAGHPDIASDADVLGRCLLAEHKAEALPLLEEAQSILEHDEDSSKTEIADEKFWAARARVELGIKPDGAVATATAACAELAADADAKDEAAECQQWLAKHPP